MIHIENLNNFHIDCDRILDKYKVYESKEKEISKIKRVLDILLEDFFLAHYTLLNIYKRLDIIINNLSDTIRLIDILFLIDDIFTILEMKIIEFEESEEYEICGNMKSFMDIFKEKIKDEE